MPPPPPPPPPDPVFPPNAAYPQFTAPRSGSAVQLLAGVVTGYITSNVLNVNHTVMLTDCATGNQTRWAYNIQVTSAAPNPPFSISTAGLPVGEYILMIYRDPIQAGDSTNTIRISLTLPLPPSGPPIIT